MQKVATVCCSCGEKTSTKENVASIHTTFKVPKSIRKVNVSSGKKKEKKVQFEEGMFIERTGGRACIDRYVQYKR